MPSKLIITPSYPSKTMNGICGGIWWLRIFSPNDMKLIHLPTIQYIAIFLHVLTFCFYKWSYVLIELYQWRIVMFGLPYVALDGEYLSCQESKKLIQHNITTIQISKSLPCAFDHEIGNATCQWCIVIRWAGNEWLKHHFSMTTRRHHLTPTT